MAHRGSGLAFGEEPARQTADRIALANRGFTNLPREEERRLNELNAGWRLELIREFAPGGRLLEAGCGRGDFLRIASARYEVRGVEPNPELGAEASREAPVHAGRLEDLPAGDAWRNFDLAAAFHVVEHVDSPSAFVRTLAARLRPGGTLVLETPDIGSWPYWFFGSSWRQLIPEHYYFFDRSTLARMLEDNGLRVRLLRHVGKHASAALVLNRLSRQAPFLRRVSALRLPLTVRINPRDVLLAVAVRER